ncbi:MAG: AbrB/MazE/SpoVT family DNA-binding domain-containing protein [Actinobacteria bacterium]|nr:MAG: AbrB/MazE/SpoVT family DNA-binding domain-containing protein [Actinomycetota bacterium]
MTESESCESCAPAVECCSLEAVVTIDERGQFVLPKDLRVRAGIGAGDRLAVVSYRGEDGGICCITLLKAESMAGAVKSVIDPALRGIL